MDRGDTLVRGDVGQPQPADDVADGVQVRLCGLHVGVDLDDGPLDDRLGRLQADPVGDRSPTRGDEQTLDHQLGWLLALLAHEDVDAAVIRTDRGRIESGTGDDLDAPTAECPLHLLGDLGVLEGHDRWQVFQDGDLGPHVAVVRGELDAHRAAADDRDGRRHVVRPEDVVAGHDAHTVWHEPGQALDLRASGQDGVPGGEQPLAGRLVVGVDGGDADVRRTLQPGGPPDVVDLVLAHEAQETFVEPLHDLAAAHRDGDRVATGLGDDEPVLVRLADPVQQVRRFEHRLGRDAAAVEAGTADLVLVDESDAEPQLPRPERGGVAAGAGTDDHEVVGIRVGRRGCRGVSRHVGQGSCGWASRTRW